MDRNEEARRIFRAAERTNVRFGQWMPQKWLEIFVIEMAAEQKSRDSAEDTAKEADQ